MGRAYQGNCFFITSPNTEFWEIPQTLEEIVTNDPNIRYLAIGRHRGHKTGYEHVHIAIEFTKKKAWTVVKDLFGDTAHVERRCGTREQAEKYLGKDNKLRVVCNRHKDRSGQGHRSDIDVFDEMVLEGARWNDLVVGCPRYTGMHRRAARDRFKDLHYEDDRVFTLNGQNEVEVFLYLGPSGSGKTCGAMRNPKFATPVDGEPGKYRRNDNAVAITYSEGKVWWDGVEFDTETIFCDEFHGGWMQFTDFCSKVKSNGAVRMEVKGSFEWCWIRTWIFTSIKHPRTWWSKTEEYEADRRQLARRLDHIMWVEPPGPDGEYNEPIELDKERFMEMNLETFEGWMKFGRKAWIERYGTEYFSVC